MVEYLMKLHESFKERMKNKFILAFVLSFVAYNWQAIMILFNGEDSLEDRLTVIGIYHTDFIGTSNFWSWNIVYPFFIALIYQIAMPYFIASLDRITIFANTQRKLFPLNQESQLLTEKLKIKLQKDNLDADYQFKDYGSDYFELINEDSDKRLLKGLSEIVEKVTTDPDKDVLKRLQDLGLLGDTFTIGSVNSVVLVDITEKGYSFYAKFKNLKNE